MTNPESVASIETVGEYVAGVQTVAYREWVAAYQELVAAGPNASEELQERARLTFLAAQRAAAKHHEHTFGFCSPHRDAKCADPIVYQLNDVPWSYTGYDS